MDTNKKTKRISGIKIMLLLLAITVALNLSYFMDSIYNAVARSVIFKSGVVLKNNVSIRSGEIDQWNGSLSTTTNAYPQSLGGVDDYNNNQTMPADSFSENWTICASANNYCGTNDATACGGNVCRQDNRTNLVWSDYILGGSDHNWFVANSCQYPNGLSGDGVCDVHGEPACQCVKQPAGSETGCEDLGDGNWRLPFQKELMQAYIDGSWGNLPHASYVYWSAATQSNFTYNAWRTTLYYGYTSTNTKTTTYDSRCVRR